MSIRQFIGNHQESINRGTNLHRTWKGRAPSPGDKLEIGQKETGRVANIISRGKKWNSRATTNREERRNLSRVKNAMNAWNRQNRQPTQANSPNSTQTTTPKSFLNSVYNFTRVFGGSKNKRTHKKRNRTKRIKRN